MTRLRSLLFARRWTALAAMLVALAVRIVVPAGMMPGAGPHGVTLVVCPGQMAMAGRAMAAAKGHASKADPAKSDAPCTFTGLLAAALDGSAPPVLPALPIATAAVLAAILVSVVLPPNRLWPPRRGPPATFA